MSARFELRQVEGFPSWDGKRRQGDGRARALRRAHLGSTAGAREGAGGCTLLDVRDGAGEDRRRACCQRKPESGKRGHCLFE